MARPNDANAIAGHVQGLREAKAAFRAMPEVFRNRMNDANEVTLREIVRNAQAKILSSPSVRSRALFNHIAWTLNRKTGRGKAGVKSGTTTFVSGGKRIRIKGLVTAAKDGGSVGWKKIQPSRYAHLVEGGTRSMPAEPFMRPAADGERAHHLSRCAAAGKHAERDLAAIGSRTL